MEFQCGAVFDDNWRVNLSTSRPSVSKFSFNVMFLSSVSSSTACNFLLISNDKSNVISGVVVLPPPYTAAMIPPYFDNSACRKSGQTITFFIKKKTILKIPNAATGKYLDHHLISKAREKDVRKNRKNQRKGENRQVSVIYNDDSSKSTHLVTVTLRRGQRAGLLAQHVVVQQFGLFL
jgi:hypothetical protein